MSNVEISPPAEPSGQRAARQLAAMRLLFDADRDRHETDIVLATVFETLADGRKRSTDELLRQVEADWPGVILTRERLESALEVAAERNYLVRESTLAGSTTWAITGTAELGIDDSRTWAKAVLDRCRAQLQDRAREQNLSVSHETAEHWTNLLLEVLHEAMITSLATNHAPLREIGRRLFPAYDRGAIVTSVRARFDDPDTAEFLTALALAALDPGSTFGTEIVHYLATGYVLYALLLGYDITDQRKELANFRGEILLLDTPVLLRLISGGTVFRWTTDLVGHIASKAGAQVAVAERTRHEFLMMLAQRDSDARKVERELRDGVPRQNLAQVAPDEVLAIWLREPSEPSWDQFKGKAPLLFTTLQAIGVKVDYAPDGYLPDPVACGTYADSIQKITATRGKRRARQPAEHDGELLCVASFVRAQASSDRVWPGAFVVTSDKSLDDAYRDAIGGNRVPFALTVSQTAGLLAKLSQPDDSEKLAELIAADIQWRTKFQRATAFGIDQAIELARSFNSASPDALAVEARSSELTFENLLSSADYNGDPTAAARAAIIYQEKRRRSATEVQREELEAESHRQRERAARAEAETRTLREITHKQSDALSEASDRGDASARKHRIGMRSLAVVILYLAAAVILVGAVALDVTDWRGLLMPGVGMAAAGKWLYEWARDPDESFVVVVLSATAWVGLAVLGKAIFA